ncbi:hypothetical protein [Lelliottia nimipressuralis]
MRQSFTVQFNTKTIFKNEVCEVTQILVGGISIGYIAEDYREPDSKDNPAVSAFNSIGLLSDAHCAGCAAECLFSTYMAVPDVAVKISNPLSAGSLVASLVLADILTPLFKR